jgi:hypothetical protein
MRLINNKFPVLVESVLRCLKTREAINVQALKGIYSTHFKVEAIDFKLSLCAQFAVIYSN